MTAPALHRPVSHLRSQITRGIPQDSVVRDGGDFTAG